MNSPAFIIPNNSVARYESLRELVIKQVTHFSSNYLMLLRQGLLVWSQLETKEITSNNYLIKPELPQTKPNELIIQILANMVIHIQEETRYAI